MNSRRRYLTLNSHLWLFLTFFVVFMLFPAAPPPAQAAPTCSGWWSLGIGGLSIGPFGTGQDSQYIGAHQRVGYNTMDPMDGFREINRLYWEHRNDVCPNDYIKVIGHSEGAGIAHAWVTANKDWLYETSVVLVADPKRAPGPGSAGLAANPIAGVVGYPLAGVDADFGAVPVLSVCNHDDVICNEEAGWFGYFTGAHGRYSMNAWDYPDGLSEVWFN